MTVMGEAERESFVEVLRSDAAFREEVRRALFTQELLDLPDKVKGLARSVAQEGIQIEQQIKEVEVLGLPVSELVDTVAEQRGDIIALMALTRQFMERTLAVLEELTGLVREGFTALDGEVGELGGEAVDLRRQLDESFKISDSRWKTRFDHVEADIRKIKRRLSS